RLGDVLASAGDLEQAVASFRDALQRNPRSVAAWSGLATTLRGRLGEEEARRIEELLHEPWLSPAEQAALHFGLAHVLDARQDWPRAADHMGRANALQKAHWAERNKEYDPAAHTRFVDRLLGVFDAAHFARTAGFGAASDRPVFVFGMPRSGTTLTEQILASHPEVFGAGERRVAPPRFQPPPPAPRPPRPPPRPLPPPPPPPPPAPA